MDTAEDKLRKAIDSETNRIKSSYLSDDSIVGIVELIRALDYQTFMLGHNLKKGDHALSEKYKYGWALPFSILYKDLILDDVPVFASVKEISDWADSVIQHSGSLELCKQLLDYKKANLAELKSHNDNSFSFIYLSDQNAEYYERASLAYFHFLMNKILEDKTKSLIKMLPSMRKNLQNIVHSVSDTFITYKATDEMDEFYSRFGYLYMMTTQTIDEFDEKDVFGGYAYKEYLDIAESIFKSAIMHRDCCMALAEKTSHKVYLRNILTYGFSLERYVDSFSDYLGWEPQKLKEIISCFILNKENYSYHLSYPKASAAPYFQLGKDICVRSTFGCLDRPIFFLNRELKRKYPKDYFNAVNNRELRFKEQLYSFFNKDRIIRIHQNINIRIGSSTTDIDAVIFDKEKNTLGLFQLKWQDTFYTSMKERFSRISNLIPKSVEWIDKVESWIKGNDHPTILKTLKIDSEAGKIESIHLFVISRSHVHFSNQSLDERATWASWYQVIEATTKMKDPLNTNPIAEFTAKLKFFSPEVRNEIEAARKAEAYNFKFANYSISIQPKS